MAPSSVAENHSSSFYTVATNNSAATFALSGADAGKFEISNAGALKFKSANVPDFETKRDANTDGEYEVTITATATTGFPTGTATQSLKLMVTNEVEAPVFSSPDRASVLENTPTTTAVYTASVSDASTKDAVTFSLETPAAGSNADDDNAQFTIDGTSGELKFVSVPDYENPTDIGTDNLYNIQITATAGSQTATKDVTITVTDVDDIPPVITSDATASTPENKTDFVYTITASEESTFTLGNAGGDEALFKLEGDKLSFKAAPDYEMKRDKDKDNVYKLELKATDAAGNVGKEVLSITVTNVVEPGIIALPAEALAFADTKVTGTLVKNLTIKNTGNDAALKVTAITYPAGFTGDWTSGAIAAGSEKVVKVSFKPTDVKSYTGKITISSNAANAADGKNTLTVSGKGILVTSIDPRTIFPGLNVFPNPAADVLNVKLPSQSSAVDIQLVDINGQVIYERKAVIGNELSIDVSGYKRGVYVLVVQSRGGKLAKWRVVVK